MPKIYKTIFRLDYPLSFAILNNFGTYAEFLHSQLSALPFTKAKTDINIPEHSILSIGEVNGDVFNLSLSLKDCNAVIEHPKGIEIDRLHTHPVFEIADHLIEKLGFGQTKRYLRIGIRVTILVDRSDFPFSKVRSYFADKLRPIQKCVADIFPDIRDFAVTIEAGDAERNSIRAVMGPYQEAEAAKYFSTNPKVKEGLIFDLDIWQHDLEIPRFKITEMARKSEKRFSTLVTQIEATLASEIAK